MDHAERLMRQAIAKLPDGVYRAETAIDGYLDSDDPAKKELPIVVTITKKDDALVVDLTGTAPQVPDRPINMPLEGTADIAIWLTIRSVLLDTDDPRPHPGERRPDPADHHRRAQGVPGQPDLPRADHRPLLPGQPARRHGDEGAVARPCRATSRPASATSRSSPSRA